MRLTAIAMKSVQYVILMAQSIVRCKQACRHHEAQVIVSQASGTKISQASGKVLCRQIQWSEFHDRCFDVPCSWVRHIVCCASCLLCRNVAAQAWPMLKA